MAERAGVPLSATTYWFDSKEELLQETLLLAAREEVERLERLVLDLAPREFDVAEWAGAVAAVMAADLAEDPIRHVAFTELALEGTRRRLARARRSRAGTPPTCGWPSWGCGRPARADPRADAPLLVAAITGFMLGQLVTPTEHFEERIFRPALERLFTKLVEPVPA